MYCEFQTRMISLCTNTINDATNSIHAMWHDVTRRYDFHVRACISTSFVYMRTTFLALIVNFGTQFPYCQYSSRSALSIDKLLICSDILLVLTTISKMEKQSMGVYTENQWNAYEFSVKSYFTIYISDIFTDLLLESSSWQKFDQRRSV